MLTKISELYGNINDEYGMEDAETVIEHLLTKLNIPFERNKEEGEEGHDYILQNWSKKQDEFDDDNLLREALALVNLAINDEEIDDDSEDLQDAAVAANKDHAGDPLRPELSKSQKWAAKALGASDSTYDEDEDEDEEVVKVIGGTGTDEDALFEAINALPEKQRKAFLNRFQNSERQFGDIDEVSAATDAAFDKLLNPKKDVFSDMGITPKGQTGNALAKLIGSLKF